MQIIKMYYGEAALLVDFINRNKITAGNIQSISSFLNNGQALSIMYYWDKEI